MKRGSQLSNEKMLAADDNTKLKFRSGLMAQLHLCLALLALAYALLAGLKTVVDFDLGWQMATGRYLLLHHAIPRTDLFSYTARGVEWIYPVLSRTIFYLLSRIGGRSGLSSLR